MSRQEDKSRRTGGSFPNDRKEEELNILTHNVLNFQGVPRVDSKKNPIRSGLSENEYLSSGVLTIMANFYRSLKAEVICLQEIGSARVAQRLSDLLGMKLHYDCPGGRNSYAGAVLVNPYWKSTRIQLPYPKGRRLERACLAVQISGGNNSLTLSSLHLPSNINRTREEGGKIRYREIIAVLSLRPPSAVIVGDLNERPDGQVYQQLQKAGYMDTAAALGKETLATYVTSRLDYVWIHDQASIELMDYQIPREPELTGSLYRSFSSVSDHSPLRVSLTLE